MILVADIKAAVGEYYGVTIASLEGQSRLAEFVLPRWVAMALSRQLIEGYSRAGHQTAGISLPMIGRRFGFRHHTSILHAIRQVDLLRKSDPKTRRAMRRLTVQLLRNEQ